MFKKILMFSFMVAALNFSGALAAMSKRVRNYIKNVQHATTLLAVQNTKQVRTFGVSTEPKLLFKRVINIQTG